jgi:uncharacterized membrane protein HdeD (DUF308 family)
MNHLEISGLVGGIISIVVGVLVIIWPRIIAYVIGAYLVIIGIIAVVAALR